MRKNMLPIGSIFYSLNEATMRIEKQRALKDFEQFEWRIAHKSGQS